MANDISSMVDEALGRLGERGSRRNEAAGKAYERLREQTEAGYRELDREAYVNRALSDRATGSADGGMTTLRQRRESNQRNILGKSARQRTRALDTLRTAQESDEVRRAADEAAQTAALRASQSAAELSELNFGKQLGLGWEQLEQQRQNSTFWQNYNLLESGWIDRKGFKDETGIEVRNRPKRSTKGSVNPAAVATMIRESQHTAFIEKRLEENAGWSEKVKAKANQDSSVPDNVAPELERAAQMDRRMNALDGFVDSTGFGTITAMDALRGSADEFIREYGGASYTVAVASLWANETAEKIAHYGVEAVSEVQDLISFIGNAGAEIDKLGSIDYFNELDKKVAAAQTAANTALYEQAEKFGSAVQWNWVEQFYPDIAEQFQYTDSAEDKARARLGLSPISCTSEAFAEALEAQHREMLEMYNEMYDGTDMLLYSGKATWFSMLNRIGGRLDLLSLTDMLAFSVYADGLANETYLHDLERVNNYPAYSKPIPVGIAAEELEGSEELVKYGETLFENYRDQYYQYAIDEAEKIPDRFYDNPSLETDLKRSGDSYDELSLEERYKYAMQKFDNLDDMKEAFIEANADYELLMSYDFEKAQQEVDQIDQEIDDAEDRRNELGSIIAIPSNDAEIIAEYNELVVTTIPALNTKLNAKNLEIANARHYQELQHYFEYLENDDFKLMTEEGANIENPSAVDVLCGEKVVNPVMFAQYVNSDEAFKELYDPAAWERGGGDLYSSIETLGVMYAQYTYMTDTEVNIYNYLLAKEGKGSADEYLDFLEETLNYRQGKADAEALDGNIVGQLLYSIPAGLDQFGSGIRQLFSKERLPTSVAQFTSNAIYEDLADDGPKMPDWLGGKSIAQIAYNTGKDVGFEAPSTLLTIATAGAAAPVAIAGKVTSAIVMGMSVTGNAYNWALAQGYDKTEAQTYSILLGVGVGVFQLVMDKAATSVGKAAKKAITEAAANIDNGLYRIASQIKISNMSEGAEAYLQEAMEPTMTNIALGEGGQLLLPSSKTTYLALTGGDSMPALPSPKATYPTLFGAVATGILKAGPLITSNIDETLAGLAVRQANKLDDLLDNALKLEPDTDAYKLAKGLFTGDIPVDDFNAGKLLMDYIDADGDTSFMYRPSAAEGMEPLLLDAGPGAIAPQDIPAFANGGMPRQTEALFLPDAQMDAGSTPGGTLAQMQPNLPAQTATPSVGDLFIQYANIIGVDDIPSFREFQRIYDEGGAAWDELTLKKNWKEGLQDGTIEPFTRFEEYKAMVDAAGDSGYNVGQDINNIKFNEHLRREFGDPPAGMVDPHAHHILFKKGLGPAQQALVREGQALLRRYGIDPIRGLENLVWAPNRIKGQHDITALRNVVEKLKSVEDFGGTYNDIVEALADLGENAAKRRK